MNNDHPKMRPGATKDALASRLFHPRTLLFILCAGLLTFAFSFKGLAVESMDVRTYLEMAKGIATHGLPYMDNGPSERFAALRVPWCLSVKGHTWGVYGPVYPYFGALFLAAGGIPLLTSVTIALMAPIAVVTFVLARKVLEDERYAFLASAATVLSTPILAKSLETTAYPLVVLFAVASTYTAVEAITSRGRCRLAFSAATGLLSSLCSGSHLLGLPMGAALIAVLGLVDATENRDRGPAWLARTPLRSLWPSAATVTSAGVALLAMVAGVLPVALLNRVRFGAYNPFTYGPTPWRNNGVDDQTIGGHLRFAMPCIVLAGIVIVALFLVQTLPRGRWLARVAILAGVAIAFALLPELRERSLRLATAAFGLIVDQSLVDLGAGYRKVPDGFGYLYGPWVIKSTLQCTPIFATVLLLPPLEPRLRLKVIATLAPVAALYAYLTLRANLPLATALGFPWVYIRYTFPALPMLAVAAMLVVRDVAPSRRAWIIGAVGGATFFAVLQDGNDERLYRQVLVLIVPIVIVAMTLAAVLLWRRRLIPRGAAAIAIATTCCLGAGMALGHDLRANLIGKTYLNDRVETASRVMPSRFAVFGYLGPLDSVLSLRASRDVQYADLHQVENWLELRPLLDHWFADQRPVFFAGGDQPPVSPWPDVTFELADAVHHFYRVERR